MYNLRAALYRVWTLDVESLDFRATGLLTNVTRLASVVRFLTRRAHFRNRPTPPPLTPPPRRSFGLPPGLLYLRRDDRARAFASPFGPEDERPPDGPEPFPAAAAAHNSTALVSRRRKRGGRTFDRCQFVYPPRTRAFPVAF